MRQLHSGIHRNHTYRMSIVHLYVIFMCLGANKYRHHQFVQCFYYFTLLMVNHEIMNWFLLFYHPLLDIQNIYVFLNMTWIAAGCFHRIMTPRRRRCKRTLISSGALADTHGYYFVVAAGCCFSTVSNQRHGFALQKWTNAFCIWQHLMCAHSLVQNGNKPCIMHMKHVLSLWQLLIT